MDKSGLYNVQLWILDEVCLGDVSVKMVVNLRNADAYRSKKIKLHTCHQIQDYYI